MVVLALVGIVAGVKITEIICKTLSDNNADARGQRYKIVLRRKTTNADGSVYEDEIEFQFGSEQSMLEHSKALHELHHAPVKSIKVA